MTDASYLYYPKTASDAKICLESTDGRHRFSFGQINCDFCGLGGVIAGGEVLYVPTLKGQEYHLRDEPNVLFYGGRGSAKAVHVDTCIPTPTCYTTMGQVRVGDLVLDERGQACQVTWKSDVHVDPSGTYRLVFDDGSEIIAAGQHEWPTLDIRQRKNNARRTTAFRYTRRFLRSARHLESSYQRTCKDPDVYTIRRTLDMLDTVKIGKRNETNYSIDTCQPWVLPKRSLSIHPYVLGVWLGDGTAANSQLTCADREIVGVLEGLGYAVDKLKPAYRWNIRNLHTQLRTLGVLRNKHIPEDYLWSSYVDRLSLLQGLMDTDGTCSKSGHYCTFTNTNKTLADGVFHLAISLGLKPVIKPYTPRLYGKSCKTAYRVTWTSTLEVFKLSRKRALLPRQQRPTQTRRFLIQVERIADAPVQCIEVNSLSHLYLVGRTGIPTHNSTTGRWDAHIRALMHPGFTYVILRRTFPELQRSHIAHINYEMEKLGGYFHNTDKIAYYPNGSRGTFAHCQDEKDVLKLLSAEFALAVFDELTTFDWEMFLKLAASVRAPVGTGYKAMVRGLTNPLGVSAAEVMSFFVHKDIDPAENPDYNPNDWHSIKANLVDNPHLDKDEYLKRFSGLSTSVKQAWVEGEFVDEAALFDFKPRSEGQPYHVITELPHISEKPVLGFNWDDQRWLQHPAIQVYRAIDHGYHPDPTICLWIAHLGDRYTVFKEKLWYKTVASEIAKDIKAESEGLRVAMSYCDPTMSIQTGADIKTIKDIYEDNGIPLENSVNNRIHYAHAIHTALAEEASPGTPRLQILSSGAPYLIKTLPLMRFDARPNHQLAIANHKHDHACVALAYFLISHSSDERRAFTNQSTPRWMRPRGNSDRWILGNHAVRQSER